MLVNCGKSLTSDTKDWVELKRANMVGLVACKEAALKSVALVVERNIMKQLMYSQSS